MKICTRCKNMVQDNEEFCGRCGGRNFTIQGQGQNQPMQGQRPQQGQPMRPQQGQQMQRPQQGQQMRPQQPQQRPMQGQGQQRPMQGQQQGQFMRPQQGQQRPMQNQQMQRPQQQMPNQNMSFDNGYEQGQMQQDFGQGFDNNAFPDQPAPKKGLFGKKNKQPKASKQPVQNNTNNGFEAEFSTNNFGPTIQPVIEDGSSVADWLKTMLILLIPVYGLIKYFMGMKDMTLPAYKRNYYKAFLIYFVACIVISIVLSIVFGAIAGMAMSSMLG